MNHGIHTHVEGRRLSCKDVSMHGKILFCLLVLNACRSAGGQQSAALPHTVEPTVAKQSASQIEKPKEVEPKETQLSILDINAIRAPDEDGYFIDGKKVDHDTFESFRGSLKPVDGTYFCDEMDTGGVSGEDLRSAEGVTYSYESESTTERNRTSLTRRK